MHSDLDVHKPQKATLAVKCIPKFYAQKEVQKIFLMAFKQKKLRMSLAIFRVLVNDQIAIRGKVKLLKPSRKTESIE